MFWPKVIFLVLAALTVGSAGIVAMSRNLVHSAFALLGTFLGVAGMYVLLSADFLAATQVLLYCGGILVLILFAVMLTDRIENVVGSNVSTARSWSFLFLWLGMLVLVVTLAGAPWFGAKAAMAVEGKILESSTAASMGRGLLLRYVLPFEAITVTILAALVGAVAIVRKEVRPPEEEDE